MNNQSLDDRTRQLIAAFDADNYTVDPLNDVTEH